MASITPKLYVLQYDYVENALEKRAPYREAHLAHFRKQVQNGNMVIGGAIDHPPTGGLIIFRTLTPKDIEEIVQQDPYFINGIVTKYTIKPYIAVTGDESLKDDLIKI
jgi:uncharacterized protein YciI